MFTTRKRFLKAVQATVPVNPNFIDHSRDAGAYSTIWLSWSAEQGSSSRKSARAYLKTGTVFSSRLLPQGQSCHPLVMAACTDASAKHSPAIHQSIEARFQAHSRTLKALAPHTAPFDPSVSALLQQ